MTSRLTIAFALFLAGFSTTHPSFAQQVTSDVVIPGAYLDDGYTGGGTCDDDGQFYRRPVNARPGGGHGVSLMRVAKDGSTKLFTLPEPEWSIGVFAPIAMGLAVLNSHYTTAEGISNLMYRFDKEGKLRTVRSVSIDFQPVAMAETKSGMTIVVGYRPRAGRDKEARKYGGAVLDANDQVLNLFEFRPTAEGGKWITSQMPRMQGDDGGANVILESGTEPSYSLARIAETGQITVHPLETVSGARYHDWFFAKGVAGEQYQFAGAKPPGTTGIDTFDLVSGRKIGTKILHPAGFAIGCYLGDEIIMLAHSGNVDKSRGLSPNALRLVTVKLE